MNNCTYSNFSWSKIVYLGNLKACKKRRKTLLNNGEMPRGSITPKKWGPGQEYWKEEFWNNSYCICFQGKKNLQPRFLLQVRDNCATVEYIFMPYYNYLQRELLLNVRSMVHVCLYILIQAAKWWMAIKTDSLKKKNPLHLNWCGGKGNDYYMHSLP